MVCVFDAQGWVSYVQNEIARTQQNISFQKREIAMLKSDAKVCERLARSGSSHGPVAPGIHWSGNYVEGPDAITVTAGEGRVQFSESRKREADEWWRKGSCELHGTEATNCRYSAHYQDSEKEVSYSGHGTLNFGNMYISYKFVQDTTEVTGLNGTQCPTPESCTSGFLVGAVAEGTWTRKP